MIALPFAVMLLLLSSPGDKLSQALRGVRAGTIDAHEVGRAIEGRLAESSAIVSQRDAIREAFCVEERGSSCTDLSKVEQNAEPAATYLSRDLSIFTVVGTLTDAHGMLGAWLYVFRKGATGYGLVTSQRILSHAGAASAALRSSGNGLCLAIYGVEQGANQSPLDVAVVRVSASGRVTTLLTRKGLLHGQVQAAGAALRIAYTRVCPSGRWFETREVHVFQPAASPAHGR